jgi:hypothetical protein
MTNERRPDAQPPGRAGPEEPMGRGHEIIE